MATKAARTTAPKVHIFDFSEQTCLKRLESMTTGPDAPHRLVLGTPQQRNTLRYVDLGDQPLYFQFKPKVLDYNVEPVVFEGKVPKPLDQILPDVLAKSKPSCSVDIAFDSNGQECQFLHLLETEAAHIAPVEMICANHNPAKLMSNELRESSLKSCVRDSSEAKDSLCHVYANVALVGPPDYQFETPVFQQSIATKKHIPTTVKGIPRGSTVVVVGRLFLRSASKQHPYGRFGVQCVQIVLVNDAYVEMERHTMLATNIASGGGGEDDDDDDLTQEPPTKKQKVDAELEPQADAEPEPQVEPQADAEHEPQVEPQAELAVAAQSTPNPAKKRKAGAQAELAVDAQSTPNPAKKRKAEPEKTPE